MEKLVKEIRGGIGMNSFVRLFKGSEEEGKIQQIPLHKIQANPFQPRKNFEEEKLDDLARSIREHGIIQPLTVRMKGDFYELIAGERRLRAAKILGLEQVPAIVKECSDREMAEIALVENLQRQDLSFFEEARGYKMLLDRFNLTQKELAKSVGKSQSTIANKLRLLGLDPSTQRKIIEHNLSERHARALLKLENPEHRKQVLEKMIKRDLTVRESEKLIDDFLKDNSQTHKPQIKKVFNDIRLYLNTLRKTISELQDWEVEIQVHEEEKDDCYEFTIRFIKAIKHKEDR